ncbi:MAG: hypothetical protein O2954_13925, partial [bacterium]|nr:hypothetical protein [bacterium]
MSGSPVYIDEKLIGAVAYSFGIFANEPIAGITPIAEMVDLFSRPPAVQRASTGRLPKADLGMLSGLVGHEVSEIRPIATPLVMSGFSPRVMSDLHETFRPLGLVPVQGGGGDDPRLPAGPFEPGAALGVQLIRGDFSVTGIGTLTYRDGDRVVGFGHPMLFGGSTAMPMTAAYIHHVFSSQFQSFKLGVATVPMGVIDQDRAPGIAGTIGTHAVMMPTQIQVRSPGKEEQFKMEVLLNQDISPALIRAAVASALISSEKLMGEVTVKARVRIELAGRPPIVQENIYAGNLGLGRAVLGMTTPLAKLLQNPFEAVEIQNVAFELDVEEQARAAKISSVRLQKTRFQPGDTAQVTVLLQPYLAAPETVVAQLKIPPQARGNRLMLVVTSAGAYQKMESKRAPGAHAARNLDDLVRLLRVVDRNDELIFKLLSTSPGVTIEGREVSALPASVLAALGMSRESGAIQPVSQTVLGEVRVKTNYVLSGNQTVLLNVDGEKDGVVFTGKAGNGGEPK